MPQFNSKEEYEKWKAERIKEIKENPNRNTTATVAKSHTQTAKSVALASIKKTVAVIRALLHNWAETSKRRKAERPIRQQAQLQAFKSSNRKINCPACRNSISINAVACPKCGQPVTDTIRLDEIARIKRNQLIIAVVVTVLILIGVIVKLLPPASQFDSNRNFEKERIEEERKEKIEEKRAEERTEEIRKNYEQDERRRQRDALQPAIIEMCRQGNDEACRQAKHWEDIR